MSDLPTCTIQSPACGACGLETHHDGDSFYCDDCGLDYGNGDESGPATFRDEEAQPCGEPCDNFWHKDDNLGKGWTFACTPCPLPKGHTSDHWTNCKVARS